MFYDSKWHKKTKNIYTLKIVRAFIYTKTGQTSPKLIKTHLHLHQYILYPCFISNCKNTSSFFSEVNVIHFTDIQLKI